MTEHTPEPRAVLVTGATGNVGRQVVTQLRAEGVPVRALTRDPAAARLPDGVTVLRGDLSDPDSLAGALDGVRAVFLVWPFLTAEAAPPLLERIAAHTSRLVYLSSAGVQDDAEVQADPINAFHADLERLVRATGLEWTFLRAGGFATNTLQWAEQIRATGVVRAPFGAASRALVHEADIAAVAVRALLDDGHAGAVHVLTGPEPLTQVEQVRLIGTALERPTRFEEQPPHEARADMLATGWPADVVDGILGAHAEMTTGAADLVTDTVQAVTGRPARTFAEWARDHAADFR
ncbi:NAD(P)H-binding protein [Marinitenerispora sediminis]|uniref:Nucleoside-diphosphate sugar epimerase n=1 Tax=Marinitenerispora sediminis TaxID=1931232 RepID=A0A368TA17_9ACTN|nr:NAD(P)H-binding protein [Marinitenerispora sediminis]RCV52916.1 nucleoside-diphosphate sugar epimerase [Marinitenerispora sediminis]RCV60733.1 nucleoside-diphosphate sugar epimerase [Marinitenerispora sediminis]RCV61595.1 nucleoside-diphosphate sugar epimerase [Marinitenerispora sediminis]